MDDWMSGKSSEFMKFRLVLEWLCGWLSGWWNVSIDKTIDRKTEDGKNPDFKILQDSAD